METVSILVSIFVVFKIGTRETLIFYMLVAGIVCLSTNFVAEKNIVFLGIVGMYMYISVMNNLCI